MGTGQDLYRRAKTRIPGGTQLLSKRPEMFLPEQWPSYYAAAKGALVRDLDGREYVDMSLMGIGACVLGYADDDVDRAVRRAIDRGVMCTLNAPEEVELADLLCELHPWADMVRYARGGGEAMAVAVRIARAATGRDRIAFCGYHGWHDWYLSANLADEGGLDGHLLPGLEPSGVPRALAGTAIPFRYNDLAELRNIASELSDEIAAVVLEPVRSAEPAPGFLKDVRRIADRIGAVLIFDEVSAGFRSVTGGIHLRYGIEPDIAVFAKGISNGYPMAAIIGRSAVMDRAQRTFISSTYWTERIGPVAAIATIQKHRRERVGQRLEAIGQKVRSGWAEAAARNGLKISLHGTLPLGHFSFEHGSDSRKMHTLFNQEMLARGFLASKHFYASYAHSEDQATMYLEAVDLVFGRLRDALEAGALDAALRGPVAHEGFARLA